MKANKTIAIVLTIIGTLLITIGVTYAFFTYSKTGLTENTIERDLLSFIIKKMVEV